MKEFTSIVTAEITMIKTISDEQADRLVKHSRKDYPENVKSRLKELFEADDVNVQVQSFVMDVKEGVK